MLNSVLLHLEGAEQSRPVIDLGVQLAQQATARVRGLTLVDTRRVEAAYDCESAVYAVAEQTRQASVEQQQVAVRANLSHACLEAGLNFDVRRSAGNPLKVLPQEARYHDLVITSVPTNSKAKPSDSDFSLRDLAALLHRGVQPLLVAHPEQRTINRILLAYDGTEASGRAIRSFLNLGIFTEVDYRLLAIGETEAAARLSLCEMGEYCLARRTHLETGCVCGSVRKVLLPYARKWQADLIVMGVERSNRLLRWILGNTALQLMKKLRCGVYAAS